MEKEEKKKCCVYNTIIFHDIKSKLITVGFVLSHNLIVT